jgi:DNA repair protein RecN (Recombination protein N)
MLAELRVRDLAIIEDLELAFGPGFNVLTGETGAGKSIIIDAVSLLLGDRASQDVVRAGAERTEVEGVFQLNPAASARVAPILADHGLEGDEPGWLLLAREVRSGGRSVARVNGRAVSTALLGEIGGRLVDIHGQGEHLSMLRESEHIGLLDRYAGLEAEQLEVAELVKRLRAVRRELENLRQDERERARRIDLLAYQVEEIRAAHLTDGEIEELDGERRRLANAEQLAALSGEALHLLQEGSEEQPSALDALGSSEQALNRLARIDPDAEGLGGQLAEAVALLTDLARELGHYREAIEFNPRRLEQVEERLHLIRSLQRKYGDSIADVLTYAERSAAELDAISHAEERIAGLESDETGLLGEIGRLGSALSAARRAAGARMAQGIEVELADLGMARARFAVQITWSSSDAGAIVDDAAAAVAGEASGRYGFDAHGLDSVAFLVAANPGEPLKPLVKVASGGETSRLMLALKTVLGRADETPTLIFDEIDQGIGGRVGGTVGRKLWALTTWCQGGSTMQGNAPTTIQGAPRAGGGEARRVCHQVLCITHLPQLAAYGDDHFQVSKHAAGERTVTFVDKLDDENRINELAHMMGTDSEAGRASAAEIMAEIKEIKSRPSEPS